MKVNITSAVTVVLTLSLPPLHPLGAQARDEQLAAMLRRSTVVGLGEELGVISDAVVRPDGSACAVDSSNQRVVCFGADGKVVLRTGRSGQGPGEFQLPVLIASDREGGLYVLDKVGDMVSHLAKNGSFIGRVSLELAFLQVNGMVIQSSGDIVVAGYLGERGVAGDSGVHVFTAQGKYLRSFGPLPVVRNADALRYWGTGWIGPGGAADLIYSPKNPYQLYLYGSGGRPTVVEPGVVLSEAPPEPFVFVKALARTQVEVASIPIVAAGPVVPLGENKFLSQRIQTMKGHVTTSWVDLITNGAIVASQQVPAALRGLRLIGLDRARSALWGIAADDDRPVLVRFDAKGVIGEGR